MIRGEWGRSWGRRCHRPSLYVWTMLGTERKVKIFARASVRKLFTSLSLKLPGEKQGSTRVVRLSDYNKAAQPKPKTSSNARLFPLFWENKEKNKTFPGMLLQSLKVSPNCTRARATACKSKQKSFPYGTHRHTPLQKTRRLLATGRGKGEKHKTYSMNSKVL